MWRRRRLGYIVLLTLISYVITKPFKRAAHFQEAGCDLLSSELGPDWYKLHRLLPTHQAKEEDDPSKWLHMPCAKGTVFDEAICACTNIVSYLFTSVEQRSSEKHTLRSPVIFDEGVTEEIERPATLLLNTETGEVKACPFKASTEDPHKYMVKVPGDRWQEMSCAAGTVFAKEVCTCTHEAGYKRSRKENEKILVLDHHDTTKNKDTISKSLEISSDSVWFNPEDIPFHRRQENANNKIKDNTIVIKPDVQVSVVNHNHRNGSHHVGGLGEPELSAKDRLPKTHTPERVRISPLSLDAVKMEEIPNGQKLDNVPLVFDPVGVRSDPTIQAPGDKSVDGTFPDTNANKRIPEKQTTGGKSTERLNIIGRSPVTDPDTRFSERHPTLAELELSLSESNPDSKILNPNVDWISLNSARKMLREKSSKVDAAFMKELEQLLQATRVNGKSRPLDSDTLIEGRIIHTGGTGRRGSLDDTLSLRNHTKSDTLPKDEVHFPLPECHKRPAVGYDEQHFELYLWGEGWVTYRCHANRIYDDRHCACLHPDNIMKPSV